MPDEILEKKKPAPESGQLAPNFSLPASAGGQFRLSEALKMGPVVAAFFKVSCGTSQFTLPFVDRLYRAYGSAGISFWAISQDDEPKTRDFCQRFGVTFPAALDCDGYKASRSYGFLSVPSIYLIEPAGNIRFNFTGFSRAGLTRLSEEIAHLIGRPPAALFQPNEQVPETKPG